MSAPAHTAADGGAIVSTRIGPHDTENDGGHESLRYALDLVAGLWQEAPFARLPDDAPPELSEYVQDIDNPHRVYAVHRATRRHDFQSLVDRYVGWKPSLHVWHWLGILTMHIYTDSSTNFASAAALHIASPPRASHAGNDWLAKPLYGDIVLPARGR